MQALARRTIVVTARRPTTTTVASPPRWRGATAGFGLDDPALPRRSPRSLQLSSPLVGMMGSIRPSSSSTTETAPQPPPPPPPLQVAIVGAGPSGFYVAKYLRSSIEKMSAGKTNNRREDGADAAAPALRPLLCTVDMIERLPTPFGLVRSGVAPDHPEVKNVEHDFEALMEGSANTSPTVDISHLGNVTVGMDVSLEELLELYDAVVLSYGCSSDRKLGIDGEESLKGIFSAREFVAWYNGHPDFVHLGPRVEEALRAGEKDGGGSGGASVVVVGQGNVALDCARILAKAGGCGGGGGGGDDSDVDGSAGAGAGAGAGGETGGLRDTDVARHALEVLEGGGGGCEADGDDGSPTSRVGRIVVVGRRGHVQGAFTIKELRELTKLRGEGYDADFVVREDELDMGTTEASQRELKSAGGRPKVRIDKLLRDAAQKADSDGSASARKKVELRFLLSPRAFLPSDVDPMRVGSVLCERTRLTGDAGRQAAEGTGRTEEIPADMVLVSIGYRGVPLPGAAGQACFDGRRGIVTNEHGKVRGAPENDDGAGAATAAPTAPLPEHGLYVAGWLKRGPTGIIGTNISDARDTVSTILSDLRNGLIGRRMDRRDEDPEIDAGGGVGGGDGVCTSDGDTSSSASQPPHKHGRGGLVNLLNERGVQMVSWEDYRRIDEAERDEGRRRPLAPREKIVHVGEMLQAAHGGGGTNQSRR